MVRILIVDDSLVFRHVVQQALQGENGISVIGSVRNGVKALEFIQSSRPDLLILDLEMPEMDGLETLQHIQEINAQTPDKPPIGVILLSSHAQRGATSTIKALEMGAFDFIGKPEASSEAQAITIMNRTLLPKILHFATRRELRREGRPFTPTLAGANLRKDPAPTPSNIQAIFIGVSTGGPRALTELLPPLCKITDRPIFVVQHMPPNFTASLAESLSTRCSHRVKEGEEGEVVQEKTIYIAPGGMHMVIRKQGNEPLTIGLHAQPPENGCRPSVDVLFRSAPNAYQGNCIAIILTGMGNDGSRSLRLLKTAGIPVIVQDEKTSVVWGMPGAAVETGFVDRIAPLLEIPQAVEFYLRKSGS